MHYINCVVVFLMHKIHEYFYEYINAVKLLTYKYCTYNCNRLSVNGHYIRTNVHIIGQSMGQLKHIDTLILSYMHAELLSCTVMAYGVLSRIVQMHNKLN